jgi:hypothetical protein
MRLREAGAPDRDAGNIQRLGPKVSQPRCLRKGGMANPAERPVVVESHAGG